MRYDIEITTALSGQTISDLPEVMRRGYNVRPVAVAVPVPLPVRVPVPVPVARSP